MATISEITFRNFKSFRNTHISLGKGFNCIVGPNGAGKSNICDGIRFVFGEGSLRALRARRVQDLISTGSDKAVIRLKIEDGNGAT
ncbi:MAG: AAA family ATPase, partial [Candidatus Micrarchaeia archaeon]